MTQINSINLTIELTNFCNFSCSYCSQGLNHSNKEMMNITYFKRNLLLFKRECERKGIKKYFFIIQGGELSVFGKQIYPYLKIINTLFDDKSVRLVFPTNFSGNLNFYKDVINIYKNSNILFILNISLHLQLLEINYKSKLLTIQEYLDKLNSRSVVIEVSILRIPDFETIYKEFIDFIHNETEILYFFDELDENDTSPVNLLYCRLTLNGFVDNIDKGQIQSLPFRINTQILSKEHTIHQAEIENKRKISYENELELLKTARR